ncbi:MAG: T9SS type A sorting domain-containing protein, partial [Chloroflexi bacterium]
SFTLTRPEIVQLMIYDMLGRHVATLVDGLHSAQQHTVRWEAGGHASGVYLARMQVGSTARTITMLLVK